MKQYLSVLSLVVEQPFGVEQLLTNALVIELPCDTVNLFHLDIASVGAVVIVDQ